MNLQARKNDDGRVSLIGYDSTRRNYI